MEYPSPKEYPDQYSVILDYDVFYPDLYSAKNESVFRIIEIDGDIHWQKRSAVERTNFRNARYEAAGIPFIWLTDIEAREKEIRWIVWNLAEKLGIKPSPMPRPLNQNII